MTESTIIIIRLLLAHAIGDFFLQPKKWIEDRNKKHFASKYIYLHCAIHAILVYAFLANWTLWWVVPIIFITHLAIDITKSYLEKWKRHPVWLFIIDQILHITVIYFIWNYISKVNIDYSLYIWNNKEFMVKLVAYLLVITPASVFISLMIKQWKLPPNTEALQKAGFWIGVMERILILTFMLLQKYEPIGYLLAAKSIFRFGELRDNDNRSLTEYVLIGTLLSFGITILLGYTINYYFKFT